MFSEVFEGEIYGVFVVRGSFRGSFRGSKLAIATWLLRWKWV